MWYLVLLSVLLFVVACGAEGDAATTTEDQTDCTLSVTAEVRYPRNGQHVVAVSSVEEFVEVEAFGSYFVLATQKSVDIRHWQRSYAEQVVSSVGDAGITVAANWSDEPSHASLNGSCEPLTVQLDITPTGNWRFEQDNIIYDWDYRTIKVTYEALEVLLSGEDIPHTLPSAVAVDAVQYSGVMPHAISSYRTRYDGIDEVESLFNLSAYGREVEFYTTYVEGFYFGAIIPSGR